MDGDPGRPCAPVLLKGGWVHFEAYQFDSFSGKGSKINKIVHEVLCRRESTIIVIKGFIIPGSRPRRMSLGNPNQASAASFGSTNSAFQITLNPITCNFWKPFKIVILGASTSPGWSDWVPSRQLRAPFLPTEPGFQSLQVDDCPH